MTRPLAFLGAALVVPGVLLVACAAGNDSNEGGKNDTATSTSTGFSDSSSSAVTSSASGIGGACAGTFTKAMPIPLDIFIMLDQSGSMAMDAGNNLSRWETIKAALGAFVNEDTSDGIGIGIQFFGQPDFSPHGCMAQTCAHDEDCTGGCTTCAPQGVCLAPYNPDIDSCESSDYTWADVPIAPLPGNGNYLLASMSAHTPGTNTPIFPALKGAVDYAAGWEMLNPSHITVVAFATDGDPSDCDTDQDHINQIAADAFAGTPSIRTFVIGVGPSLDTLDGIAAAGGTTTAFHIDLDSMATQSFLDALNTIRGVALPCTYEIPPPPSGMMEDFDKVNVQYKPGDGTDPQIFPRVDSKADCPADGDGWYYDDNNAPTQINLCDSSCSKLKSDIMAELDIELGCQTIVP